MVGHEEHEGTGAHRLHGFFHDSAEVDPDKQLQGRPQWRACVAESPCLVHAKVSIDKKLKKKRQHRHQDKNNNKNNGEFQRDEIQIGLWIVCLFAAVVLMFSVLTSSGTFYERDEYILKSSCTWKGET